MFIDSHCHIDFPELADNIDSVWEKMRENQVDRCLCNTVNLEDFPRVLKLAEAHDNVFATVGVHPDYEDIEEPDVARLVQLANHPKIIGIGETGLDYYRLTGDLEWQRQRFRTHIRAAIKTRKPLIIHTRSAAEDTLKIMREENAADIGGVMHCFTETLDIAEQAMAMNFYISISGIVTFKNAVQIKEVAQKIPLERLLIETDSPYLAPVPFRGKLNQPGYVKHVAEEIAKLRGVSVEEIAQQTTKNFNKLFNINK